MTDEQGLPDFNKLWDFSQPAETESKFRALLLMAQSANDPSYLAQLLTQIARTQGLQSQFEAADATLDQAEALLTDGLKLARVRYWLEAAAEYLIHRISHNERCRFSSKHSSWHQPKSSPGIRSTPHT